MVCFGGKLEAKDSLRKWIGYLKEDEMSCEPVSRRHAHSEGVTHLTFDSKK